MSDDEKKCAEFTASRSWGGSRLRCSFNWRFTVTREGEQERRVCLKHMRKLRGDGWTVVKS